MSDWNDLTDLTRGSKIVVEKVRLEKSGIRIEGEFDLPTLIQLNSEEQVFVSAFIQAHGSIKEMEKLFNISYPTVKNRLNSISRKLGFVTSNPPPSKSEVLEKLERGELSVEETLERLRK